MKTYWNDEYFTIEGEGKDKEIHFFGYFYDEGNPGYNDDGEEDDNYTSRSVEYSGFIYGLKEFIDIRDEKGKNIRNWITETASELKQYEGDMTPDGAVKSMNEFYGEEGFKELALEDITMDTPAGNYVDHKD